MFSYTQLAVLCLAVGTMVSASAVQSIKGKTPPLRVGSAGLFKGHDNSWCFKGVYDYDNCPGKSILSVL